MCVYNALYCMNTYSIHAICWSLTMYVTPLVAPNEMNGIAIANRYPIYIPNSICIAKHIPYSVNPMHARIYEHTHTDTEQKFNVREIVRDIHSVFQIYPWDSLYINIWLVLYQICKHNGPTITFKSCFKLE